jgi:hypothetical protein
MSRALQSLNAEWRKSTRSASNGACVEVSLTHGLVAVRDSKDSTGPVLRFSPQVWQGFLDSVHGGMFDRPAS